MRSSSAGIRPSLPLPPLSRRNKCLRWRSKDQAIKVGNCSLPRTRPKFTGGGGGGFYGKLQKSSGRRNEKKNGFAGKEARARYTVDSFSSCGKVVVDFLAQIQRFKFESFCRTHGMLKLCGNTETDADFFPSVRNLEFPAIIIFWQKNESHSRFRKRCGIPSCCYMCWSLPLCCVYIKRRRQCISHK